MTDARKPIVKSVEESKAVSGAMFAAFNAAENSFADRDDIRLCAAKSDGIIVLVRSLIKSGVTPEKMHETLTKFVDGANEEPEGLVMMPPAVMAAHGINSGDTMYVPPTEPAPADAPPGMIQNGKRTMHTDAPAYTAPPGTYDVAEERLDSGRMFVVVVPANPTADESSEIISVMSQIAEALNCHATDDGGSGEIRPFGVTAATEAKKRAVIEQVESMLKVLEKDHDGDAYKAAVTANIMIASGLGILIRRQVCPNALMQLVNAMMLAELNGASECPMAIPADVAQMVMKPEDKPS